MKNIFLPMVLAIFISKSFAQHMRVQSFKELPTDMQARLHGKSFEGAPCALIKLVSTYKGFAFDVGGAVLVDVEEKVGETWLWVNEDLRKLTIRHNDLGVIREHRVRVKPLTVYEMRLATDKITTIVEEALPAFVLIKSKPEGASVYIDDKPTGMTTPCQKSLPMGAHTLTLKKEMYESLTETFIIKQGQTKKITKTLVPNFGTLLINTEPSGAEVYIDGKPTETKTPFKKILFKGKHTIELKRALHESIHLEMVVKQGETKTIFKKLLATYGTLQLTTTEGAEVLIDRTSIGKGSITKVLAPGSYFVEIKKQGHYPIKKNVTIRKRENTRVQAPLKAQTGILQLSTEPFEAEVYIAGKYIGQTPLIKRLPVGQYPIKITKANYNDLTSTYTIQHNKTTIKKEKLDDENYYVKGKRYDDKRDYKKAVYWYQKAAEQGNAEAQVRLGEMYYWGQGVARDYKKAKYWFQKAAEQGNAIAQYYLGKMYHYGFGVAQDHKKAKYWYQKACDNGDKNACKLLEEYF